jgi:hypothetical protein
MRIVLCPQCGEFFEATHNAQRICSDECRAERKSMAVSWQRRAGPARRASQFLQPLPEEE